MCHRCDEYADNKEARDKFNGEPVPCSGEDGSGIAIECDYGEDGDYPDGAIPDSEIICTNCGWSLKDRKEHDVWIVDAESAE